MGDRFNFLNQPVLAALTDAALLLPGLEYVDLIFHGYENDTSQVFRVRQKDSETPEIIYNVSGRSNAVLEFANSINGTRWYEESEIPYNKDDASVRSGSIFDEILKRVLCIGFDDSEKLDKDVFVFYFREDAREFGPMRKDKVLETTQKIVIERLVQTSLRAIINNYKQNRKAMVVFNKSIQSLLSAKQQKIDEQAQQILKQTKDLDKIIDGLVRKINLNNLNIELSEAAKLFLRPHLYDISVVNKALTKALELAVTLSFGLSYEKIILHEDYFIELKQHSYAVTNEQIKQVDEYSADTKMFKFLDSLEMAVRKLSTNGTKPTSSLVGSMLEQPITAAAISDKLKNHSRKINLLLKEYPNHWQLIRNKFRPIVNIQEKSGSYKVA